MRFANRFQIYRSYGAKIIFVRGSTNMPRLRRFIGFENVFLVVFHAELFQQFHIFVPERLLRVVLLLVLDVVNYRVELRTGVRERAKSFLP